LFWALVLGAACIAFFLFLVAPMFRGLILADGDLLSQNFPALIFGATR
jgi:hypothetical protein